MDLHGALYEAMEQADSALADMARLGEERARADRAYREAKAERMLFERAENHTPASMVADLAKGDPEVAELKVAAECADALYEANREALLWSKKKVDTVRELIAREFGGAR